MSEHNERKQILTRRKKTKGYMLKSEERLNKIIFKL